MTRGKGEGSVYYAEKEDRWVAQVDNGWTRTGRRRYIRRYRKSKREALRVLAEIQRMADRGLDPTARTQTLSKYLDAWLEGLEGTRAPKTIAAYRADIAHVKRHIGKVQLEKLTPNHVRQMLAALPGNGLAPKTVLNIRTTLHTAIEQAHKDQLLTWNPVSVVSRPKVDRDDIEPLTVAQAKAVLKALQGHRLYALYAVGVACGLRLGEALGLTWNNVDLDTGVIKVRTQPGRVGKKGDRHYVLRDLKSKRSRRDIPLPAFAVTALKEHRKRQAEERLKAGERWIDGCCHGCGGTGWGLVFTTFSDRSAGRPIHETTVRKELQDACEAAKLPRFRPHDLRHTAATLLLAQRVPLAEIQQILGHSSIHVTRDVYSHLDVEHLRGAAGTMEELLG